MQGHHLLSHPHHQQQLQHQLAGLLAAALPQPGPATVSADSSPSISSHVSPDEAGKRTESDRVAAIESLQRSIIHPPNALVIGHSAAFLSQGLSQLLSDRSHPVRRAAAVAYGSLSAIICAPQLSSNLHQNYGTRSAGIPEFFIGWALPLIKGANAELALAGLRQFLQDSVASNVTIVYVLRILKSLQDLLEDERMPLDLLHQVLGALTIIASKYEKCFQPHFVDIIDILLGWALVPDLSEKNRKTLTDSFIQLKNNWIGNLPFSLNLLSKFLGDMEVLVQDNGIIGNSQKNGRLIALFCCFSSVIQVTAFGVLDKHIQAQISEPLEGIVPRFLSFLLVAGQKHKWDKWMEESWRCIVLLAEILMENFFKYYETVIDILFLSAREFPSLLLQKVLEENKRILSLQKLGLLPSHVLKILQFDSPFSNLRLHPNRSIVVSIASIYLLMASHDCDDTVLQWATLVIEELMLLKKMLMQCQSDMTSFRHSYSESDMISLIKFDLSVISSFRLQYDDTSLRHGGVVSHYKRSTKLASFLVENFDPFQPPLLDVLELQVCVAKTLQRVSEIEIKSSLILSKTPNAKNERQSPKECCISLFVNHLKKYDGHIVRSLYESSPLAVKLEALQFLCSFCGIILKACDESYTSSFFESFEFVRLSRKLLWSVLRTASDREEKVRVQVASTLDLLLQARLISPENFGRVAIVTLERLGDHDASVKKSFIQLLSTIVPVTAYFNGVVRSFGVDLCEGNFILNWKHLFALKKLPRQLRSQQFLSILSYISQRSKLPQSSWIQRLVFSCHGVKDPSSNCHKETGNEDSILNRICPVNDVAAIWWATHEAARHCVDLRLRTNLGGPAQTFAAFERMLLDISQLIHADIDQREGNLHVESSHIRVLPMRLLLDFIESLKKSVHNAYDGSCVLPSPGRQSSLFFRANRKVCEEWFSRICEPMLKASRALHCHDAVFYYCTSRLQELENLISSSLRERNQEFFNALKGKFSGDVMMVLRDASLALSRNHEPEMLVGLHNWAVMVFSPLFTGGYDDCSVHFSWMMGLVYEAYGQYEKAAAHFSHLLQSEVELSSMGSDGIQFSISRIIECYTKVSDWKSLDLWLSELQILRATHAGKAYCGSLTTTGSEMNAVHALARFDEGDTQGSWGYLDLTPKSCGELTLDLKMGLERSDQMLLRAMLLIDQKDKMLEELKKAEIMLKEGISVICMDGFSQAIPYAIQLHCISVLRDYSKFNVEDQYKKLWPQLNSLHVLQLPVCKFDQDCSMWLKVHRVYRLLLPSSPVTLFLGKRLLDVARKQRNFMLANRMVHYLNDHLSMCWQGDKLNFFSDALTYDKIRLDYSMGNHAEALINLWSFVLPEIMSPENTALSKNGRTLKAKALLKLSKWLKQDRLISYLENVIYKIEGDLENISSSLTRKLSMTSDDNLISNINLDTLVEEIVGMTAKHSHVICPSLSKAWFQYASWCYNQARNSFSSRGTVLQSCTLSSILLPEVIADRFTLTEEEIVKIESILNRFLHQGGQTTNSVNLDDSRETLLMPLVQQVAHIMQSAAGIEHYDGECPSNALMSKFLAFLERINSKCEKDDILTYVDGFLDIWWSLRRRRVSLFGKAAHGYLQYLSLSSSKTLQEENERSEFIHSNEESGSCTLAATLCVLHILLDYGVELKESLAPGLARFPLSQLQEIIPQLFARLSSHPQQEVREELEGLLMMLAKNSPWSIVYPTLVDANSLDAKSSEELSRILACLTRQHPKLIHDVQLIISELGSITVLWEDQWLSTLQDLHPDVMKRVNTLKEEAVRIEENTSLNFSEKNKINAAKYSAMMAPVIVALERRLASTSREPETPHEIWFQKEYNELLKSLIISFKTPPASAQNLGDVWKPFNSIISSLLAYQRKQLISLSEVAPRLSLLGSSDAPMPGLDADHLVTVSSLGENLAILSSKTRPKKLIFLGSDAKEYTYLLKGREDLRLDARIMQLLRAVDRFIHYSSHSHGNSLAIRYYSVTPISGRAGLIQWVDQVISVYSVYRAWQSRDQFSHSTTVSVGDSKNNGVHVPHPGDMFYGKIIPALKEKGIRKVVSRRDWPHDVKRKVLLELMKETPRLLLQQELWCASEDFKAFFARSKRFSGTVAVMSMLGYVLGLGDRHLDNILLDFATGDAVHIDYNVCFDKGKRLKIPEIVPFRLTQTIEAALGLTGIEGVFKSNCEGVLDVIRKNKHVILLLLEAFVWDPLVEWTREDVNDDVIGGEEKKGMEIAVSLSLFASRFQEVRVPLQEHCDLLLCTLPVSKSALEKFLGVLNHYEIVSAIFFQADKERSSILQHEISANSILVDATSFTEKAKFSFEAQAQEFSNAKAIIGEKAHELAEQTENHGRILDALRSGSIDEIRSLIKPIGSEEALSVAASVSAAGVPFSIVPEPTQAHCYELDREVSQTVTELNGSFILAIDALEDYALALQRVLPLNYIATSSIHAWAQILQLCLKNVSADTLSLSRRRAGELLAETQEGCPDSIKQRYGELVLKVDQYAAEIKKVKHECSVLVNSVGSDTEIKLKDRLVTSFTKFMRSVGYVRHETKKDFKAEYDLVEKATKVVTVLQLASDELFKEVKNKLSDFLGQASVEECIRLSSEKTLEFEEHVEKCALLVEFSREIRGMMDVDLPGYSIAMDDVNWVSVFQGVMNAGKSMINQMLKIVLPEVIMSVVSYNAEVMEAFGFLSQIRGTVDSALEQLIDIELERAALIELEENYFMKVSEISEKKLALEESSLEGRENLSWEEAEELASQEEAYRVQLDQLHTNWNQKDTLNSNLKKRESSVMSFFVNSERQLLSLLKAEEGYTQNSRNQALISILVKSFSELESHDQIVTSYGVYPGTPPLGSTHLKNLGNSTSASIWKLANLNLLKNHSFFVWKISMLDSFLGSCIRDISSARELNMGFEQIYSIIKRKLSLELQWQFNIYLKEKIAPALMICIGRVDEILQRLVISSEEMYQSDPQAVKRVQKMLHEYCNARQNFRAARSTVSRLTNQADELSESLQKTILEIVQMEWLHDKSLPYKCNIKELSQNIISSDKISPAILNLRRHELLEKMQLSMRSITSSLENLKSSERTSTQTEAQLERAMSWACAGPVLVNSGSSSRKDSGIPSQFHEHLQNRRQLLWAIQEQASNIISICSSVIAFEASRDGLFITAGNILSWGITNDYKLWQKTCLNSLARLDAVFHSFTRAENEWILAQSNLAAATNSFHMATNELSVASAKAKSALGDFQNTLADLWDSVYEASAALSAFSDVSKSHNALTVECGNLLEEVLTITEGLHDVYRLGKEASALHDVLMADLSKACAILLPLEASLSTNVAALSREREMKADLSPMHGQALYQFYCFTLRESCQSLRSLVPSVTHSVKELHSMITKLVKAATRHASNLHEAFEGLGESPVERPQELSLSSEKIKDFPFEDDDEDGGPEVSRAVRSSSSQDDAWISPPDSIYSSSPSSVLTSSDEQSSTQITKELTSSIPSVNESQSQGELVLPNQDELAGVDRASFSETEKREVGPVGSENGNSNPANESQLGSREIRGKNPYAVSVLRQIERKLDGRELNDKRPMSVSEQVDYLLKEATSLDNLCNMYEGWTPWI